MRNKDKVEGKKKNILETVTKIKVRDGERDEEKEECNRRGRQMQTARAYAIQRIRQRGLHGTET